MKAETKKETKANLYNADAEQTVSITVGENTAKRYSLKHKFKPVTDKRFISFKENVIEAFRRSLAENDSVDSINPNGANHLTVALWDELVIERIGYVEREDWKESTSVKHKTKAVDRLLATRIRQSEDTEELFDDDAPTQIKILCLFNEEEIETVHIFSKTNQKDLDAFLRISAGSQPNGLASAAKIDESAELIKLYDKFCIKSSGYDGRVPAKHKIEAVMAFFI